MTEHQSFYASVGVDPHKKNVHRATQIFDKGVLPGAFCKIFQHPSLRDKVIFGHADGPGTMASAAYKMWQEGWPIDVLKRPSVAAFRMNSEDAACAGLLGPFGMVNSINRNPWTVPGAEPLEMIMQGLKDCVMLLEAHGIMVIPVGGETADVGALQSTYNIDVVFYMIDPFDPADVIDASNIAPDHVLVGLGSFGQCEGETEVNSGVRANGITGLENGLLSSYYAEKYPETVPWKMPKDRVYKGNFRLEDPLPGDSRFTIGSALTCEVRTYMVYLKRLFDRIDKKRIGGSFTQQVVDSPKSGAWVTKTTATPSTTCSSFRRSTRSREPSPT